MAVMEDPEAVFDRKQANTYEYKYNNANTDYYVYSAFEALCLNCGFFSWTDIGTLRWLIIKVILTFYII